MHSDENDIAISDLSPYEHLTNRDGSYTHIVRDYYLPAMEPVWSVMAFLIPTGFIILYRKSEAVTVRLRTSRPVSRLH